jgi:hypothetical protein
LCWGAVSHVGRRRLSICQAGQGNKAMRTHIHRLPACKGLQLCI